MNRFVLALAALCTISFASPALADAISTTPPATVAATGTYDFDFSATGAPTYQAATGTTTASPLSYLGSGSLTVGNNGLVTAATGTINGFNILGVTSYASADNILYDGSVGALLDFSGLSFLTSGGSFAIGNTGAGSYGITDSVNNANGYCCGVAPVNLNVAAVPEPATWAMMLMGFGAIGFTMRRKRTALIPQLA